MRITLTFLLLVAFASAVPVAEQPNDSGEAPTTVPAATEDAGDITTVPTSEETTVPDEVLKSTEPPKVSPSSSTTSEPQKEDEGATSVPDATSPEDNSDQDEVDDETTTEAATVDQTTPEVSKMSTDKITESSTNSTTTAAVPSTSASTETAPAPIDAAPAPRQAPNFTALWDTSVLVKEEIFTSYFFWEGHVWVRQFDGGCFVCHDYKLYWLRVAAVTLLALALVVNLISWCLCPSKGSKKASMKPARANDYKLLKG